MSTCIRLGSIAILLLTLNALCSVRAGEPEPNKTTPAMDVLHLFAAAGIPVSPEETPRKNNNVAIPPNLPGEGIARYPMLFFGEDDPKLFVVKEGKVVWRYFTGKGPYIDDAHLMSNGNILFARRFFVAEVTPQKKVVWRYDAPTGEIISVQPIGLDKVMFLHSGIPSKLMVINKKTGAVEVDHVLPEQPKTPKQVHGFSRRVRMTPQGNYLLTLQHAGKVIEYDKDFNVVWSYSMAMPWAAIRLKNGNTLINSAKDHIAREVNPKGETVWEFSLNTDLPSEFMVPCIQSSVRLANGNTILCSVKGTRTPQLIEVTPDKKVVWVLNDRRELGGASGVQILNEPGIPENPGDCQR